VPPKKQLPAPIDRPLSRAYLREFTGWSTAYPPGVSDATSLRIMENVMVNRDASVRVRPGLRYLSYEPDGTALATPMVGSHEPFFLNDGTQAYLFATRELDGRVGFRTLANEGDGLRVHTLEDSGFTVDPALPFSEQTTYVKYLQIDNKIFALSNAGETMRLFYVGAEKSAKALHAIEVPAWSADDKLTVVHPDAAWINGASPTSTRTNRYASPDMGHVTPKWIGTAGTFTRTSTYTEAGAWAMRLESLPTRTNLCTRPLNDVASTGVTGWYASTNALSVTVSGSTCKLLTEDNGTPHRTGYAGGPRAAVKAGQAYQVGFDVTNHSNPEMIGVRFRFVNSAGAYIGDPVDKNLVVNVQRMATGGVTAPSGAVSLQYYIYVKCPGANAEAIYFKNVTVCNNIEVTTFFSGASGTNYFWTGTANASASVYHPPQTISVYTDHDPITPGAWCSSLWVRAGSTPRNVTLTVDWCKPGTTLASTAGTPTPDSTSWARMETHGTAPAGTTFGRTRVTVAGIARDEYHYLDSGLFEPGSTPGTYFDGNTENTSTNKYAWSGTAYESNSTEKIYAAPVTAPPAETKTANTLRSSVAADNDYSFGFFYTFFNEVGESAGSQTTVVRCQRPWVSWLWETPNAAGEPSGTDTNDPLACADQLVAILPSSVWDQARAQGALGWNLYSFSWSEQAAVPVTAVRVAQRVFKTSSTYGGSGWLAMTPQMTDAGDEISPLPRGGTRYNYTDPSRAAQGLVAADRMVLVNDPTAQAVIKWSSNQQGSYTDFSASRGGGYKTLTSGNLYTPACVKLWQNPQSADTLTILCRGVDGMSTGYYMAPSQIASQSEAVNVMGFEETTATPGTTSPYGCEIFNNSLYHPLDEMLMKSSANNYNISHKSQTDQIQDVWRGLQDKHHIVSALHDNRIYFLVNNPQGEGLLPGCWGNEVWVYDAAAESGTWSRWLTQGQSLRKIDRGSRVVMSLVRPEGLFYFDDTYASDDVVVALDRSITQQSIPWKLETNTQGANRAHDAWAHLQQCNIVLGYFQGTMRYGVRSFDLHGQVVEVSKIVRDTNPATVLSFDLEDFLLVRRDLREWFFFAESVVEEGVTLPSYGQLSLVQYRYAPVSVNVGYEYGSVETFEYARAGELERTTTNGTPMPYIDTRRP
jgi:hypothetical protein